MKARSILYASAFAAVAILAVSCNGKKSAALKAAETPFENPIIRHDCADPTILDNRERDGYFYLASTQTSAASKSLSNVPVYRSKDLLNWEFVGDAVKGKPEWMSRDRRAAYWAPDLNYVDGKYILYYAKGVWGDHGRSASGVAISNSPTGPYTDLGMIVDSASTGVRNSIDPNFFQDTDGKKYLFWGSLGTGSGIWGVELSDDGLRVKEGFKPVYLGATNMEGTYVHKRGDWYYIFTSKGSCCEGEKSTYRVLVARSKNVLGPYTSPEGKPLTDHDYEYVIMHGSPDFTFVGTGHNAEIVTDDAGQDWMPMHVFWKGNNYRGRATSLEPVFWSEDGWPHFTSDTMQKTVSHSPVFWK